MLSNASMQSFSLDHVKWNQRRKSPLRPSTWSVKKRKRRSRVERNGSAVIRVVSHAKTVRVSNGTLERNIPVQVDPEMRAHDSSLLERGMHSDLEGLEVVCQHYRRHYEQAELRRLKNLAHRLRNEITRLSCELCILRILLRVWLRNRGVGDEA